MEAKADFQYCLHWFMVLAHWVLCGVNDVSINVNSKPDFSKKPVDISAKCGKILENIAKDYEETKQAQTA